MWFIGITDQRAQFVALMILIKQFEVGIRHFFTICDICVTMAAHYDAYILRVVIFFVDNDTLDGLINHFTSYACVRGNYYDVSIS